MVQEPSLAVLLVFLKGNSKRVGDVDGLAVVLSEKDADHSFVGCS